MEDDEEEKFRDRAEEASEIRRPARAEWDLPDSTALPRTFLEIRKKDGNEDGNEDARNDTASDDCDLGTTNVSETVSLSTGSCHRV